MLRLVTRSSLLPVTLDEFSQFARRDGSTDDALALRLLEAGTRWAEDFTGFAFVDQTWDFYFDAFPALPTSWPINSIWQKSIYIPRPPLLEVLGVFGRDTTEAETSDYLVDYGSDKSMGRIYLSSTGSWPSTDGAPNAGRIRFRAGFVDTGDSPASSGDVPEDIKTAICIYANTLYENREQYAVGTTAMKLPWGCEELLRNYRVENSMA